MAEIFQRVCENWLEAGFILRPNNLSNQQLLDYSFLEEIGLLQDVNGNLNNTRNSSENGEVFWKEGNLLLVLQSKSSLRFPVIRITRIGREVLGLLPPRDLKKTLKAVAAIHLERVDAADLRVITQEYPDGSIAATSIELLK